jgi:hypothetical protein
MPWPLMGCSYPTTAASAHLGCATRADSTSAVPMLRGGGGGEGWGRGGVREGVAAPKLRLLAKSQPRGRFPAQPRPPRLYRQPPPTPPRSNPPVARHVDDVVHAPRDPVVAVLVAARAVAGEVVAREGGKVVGLVPGGGVRGAVGFGGIEGSLGVWLERGDGECGGEEGREGRCWVLRARLVARAAAARAPPAPRRRAASPRGRLTARGRRTRCAGSWATPA